MNSCELDVIEELKVEERMNLFAVFPIGTTMQDGGKRKRSIDGHTIIYHKEYWKRF